MDRTPTLTAAGTTAEALFGECSVEVIFSGSASKRNSSSPSDKKKRSSTYQKSTSRVATSSPLRPSQGLLEGDLDPASPSPVKAKVGLMVDSDLPRLISTRRSVSNDTNNMARASSLLGSKRPRTSTPDDGENSLRISQSSGAFSIGREDEKEDYDEKTEEVDDFDASYNITSDDECPTPPYHAVESRLSLMTEKDLDRLSRRVEWVMGRSCGRRSDSQLSN